MGAEAHPFGWGSHRTNYENPSSRRRWSFFYVPPGRVLRWRVDQSASARHKAIHTAALDVRLVQFPMEGTQSILAGKVPESVQAKKYDEAKNLTGPKNYLV